VLDFQESADSSGLEASYTRFQELRKAASFLYLRDIQDLTQEIENLLGIYCAEPKAMGQGVLEALGRSFSMLRFLLSHLEAAVAGDRRLQHWPQVTRLVDDLRLCLVDGMLEDVQESPEATDSCPSQKVELFLQAKRARLKKAVNKMAENVSDVIQVLMDRAEGESRSHASQLAHAASELTLAWRDMDRLSLEPMQQRLKSFARTLAQGQDKDVDCLFLISELKLPSVHLECIERALHILIEHQIKHSIETREERKRRAKPEVATLLLLGGQASGQIQIEIACDGVGEDPRARKGCQCFSQARELIQDVEGELEVYARSGASTTYLISFAND
jgi:two-component system chemotaxis sensor kinase CheA